MTGTQQLRNEHEGIGVMLDILERIFRDSEAEPDLNTGHFDAILEFLKVFVDRCHHAKEEDLLFPVLITAGVPKEGHIAFMLADHETGRTYVEAMSRAYSACLEGDRSSRQDIGRNAFAYVSLMRDHIEKENRVVFAMADSFLSEATQDELLEGFERIEKERIGMGKHEEFHALLANLSRIYLHN